MFDIGFSELLLIAVVALVVLGPERLPKAARFAGLWVRKARAQWASVRSELERELAAEELQRSLDESRDVMRDLDASMRETGDDARREFDAMRAAALADEAPIDSPTDAPEESAPDAPAEPAPTAMTPTDTRGEDDVPGR